MGARLIGPRAIWVVIGAGLLLRLALVVTTSGQSYDMGSFETVALALRHNWSHVYSQVNPGAHTFHWPYPPGYFAWIAFADAIRGGGLEFARLIRIPPVLADAAIAWLLARELGRRAGSRAALAAAALVSFGPVFVVISGYHGQIDSLAILPAVAAALVWERGGATLARGHGGGPRIDRALLAGALIGVAGSIKTVPIVMVLALLPTARDWREGARLVAAAGAVVVVSLAPFLITDLAAVRHVGRYGGVPGAGGLSLLVQPDLARVWLTGPVRPSGVTKAIVDHATILNLVVFAGIAVLLAWRRPPAIRAAAILWLGVWAFGSGFFFQYLVWGLPFLILDGRLFAVAALQAVVLVPMLLFYLGPWHSEALVVLYAGVMLALWLSWCAGIVALARRAPSGLAHSHAPRAPAPA